MYSKLKIISFFITLFFIIVSLAFLSSALYDIVNVYNLNILALPEEFFLSKLLSFRTYLSFITNPNPFNYLSYFIIFVFAFLFFSTYLSQRLHRKYLPMDNYGSHGTARFQNLKEIKNNYYEDDLGWFLGSVVPDLSYKVGMEGAYHNIGNELNMQTILFGSPGSFKTTSVVLPNIFHIPYIFKNREDKADLIITDPKSELFSLTANYLIENGYEVRVLDFINLKYGDSLNPIEFITCDKELMEISEGYITSISESSNITVSSDSFWEQSEGQLLGALIGYVRQVFPKGSRNFKEVLGVLTSDNVKDFRKANELFKKYGIQGASKQLWNNFLLSEDKVRSNILIGLATKLKHFSTSGIENITSRTTVDITKFGAKKERPIALFILMPDKDRTYSPIINSIMTTILNQLYKTANEYNNVLPNPVFLILEEMANIGRIPDIEIMLGTMRSRRIYPLLVFQSLPQMKNRYTKVWEDILSMCDTHYYLGINDNFTADYCSNFLGKTTIKIQSQSNSLNGSVFDIPRSSESQNYFSRNLMLPDELKRMDQKVAILNQRSLYPSILYKVQYRHWNESDRICPFYDLKTMYEIGKGQFAFSL